MNQIFDKKKIEVELAEGKVLPLMEEFYSIQGEGFHTGKAAYFVRIGGCDVGCQWCDEKESWNPNLHPAKSTDLIIKNIIDCPAGSVVVTGGEPLMYNLDYFCKNLKEKNIRTFLETSGSHSISGQWDWIALSPKKKYPPLKNIVELANELKVIISEEKDFDWAEHNAKLVSKKCLLYFQPEWSRREKIIPAIIEYVLKNPQWKISMQTHKYLNIP